MFLHLHPACSVKSWTSKDLSYHSIFPSNFNLLPHPHQQTPLLRLAFAFLGESWEHVIYSTAWKLRPTFFCQQHTGSSNQAVSCRTVLPMPGPGSMSSAGYLLRWIAAPLPALSVGTNPACRQCLCCIMVLAMQVETVSSWGLFWRKRLQAQWIKQQQQWWRRWWIVVDCTEIWASKAAPRPWGRLPLGLWVKQPHTWGLLHCNWVRSLR